VNIKVLVKKGAAIVLTLTKTNALNSDARELTAKSAGNGSKRKLTKLTISEQG